MRSTFFHLRLALFLLLSILITSCDSPQDAEKMIRRTTKVINAVDQALSQKEETQKLPDTVLDPEKLEQVEGKVIGIMDGDTYEILLNNHDPVRVRMEGIDAPERGMPFYQVSKKYLSSLCFGKTVTLKVTGKDQYGRLIGFTYLPDGREAGHEMLRSGYAWHYKKYNQDSEMAALEEEARLARKGLWVDKKPMAPWDNRKFHRMGISTKDSFNISESRK